MKKFKASVSVILTLILVGLLLLGCGRDETTVTAESKHENIVVPPGKPGFQWRTESQEPSESISAETSESLAEPTPNEEPEISEVPEITEVPEPTEENEFEEEVVGDGVFKIGVFLSLSGPEPLTTPGSNALNGIQLAVEDINSAGGFNGERVEILPFDTKASVAEASIIVQEIILRGDIDAVIGSVNSNEFAECQELLNEAGIYNFGLGTSPSYMKDPSYIYTFRACANSEMAASYAASVVKEVMGYHSVAIMSGTDNNGITMADAFETECGKQGITVTTRETCGMDDTDFSAQISRIISTDPDTVYMSLIGSTFGAFVRQIREMGYRGTLMCKEVFSEEYQETANEGSFGEMLNSDYIYVDYPYVKYNSLDQCDIPVIRDFIVKYYDYFGEMPTHETAYRGWDTIQVMWEASKIAGKNDSESLRVATNQVQIEGLAGTLDFTDGSREGIHEYRSYMLENGQYYELTGWMRDGHYEAYKSNIWSR